jgi:hypothetical protein
MLGVRCDPRSDIYALGGILLSSPPATRRSAIRIRLPSSAGACTTRFRRRASPRHPRWLRKSSALSRSRRARAFSARACRRARDAGGGRAHRAQHATAACGTVDASRDAGSLRFEPAPCPPSSRNRRCRALSPSRSRRRSNERLRGAARAVRGRRRQPRLAPCLHHRGPSAATLSASATKFGDRPPHPAPRGIALRQTR